MFYADRYAIEKILTPELSQKLSNIAFKLQSQQQVEQPLRNIIGDKETGMMGTMPIHIKTGEYKGFGLKSVVVRFNKNNYQHSHIGSVLIFDEKGVSDVAVVDAGTITEIRTAAASAYATDLISPKQANKLAILGTGVQAKAHLTAMLHVRPIKQVTIWGRTQEKAQALALWCEQKHSVMVDIADTAAQAVADSDIICTTTSSSTPILTRSDLPEKCHINAVGSSALGFQELHEDIYTDVSIFTDSNESVQAAAQCIIKAKELGIIKGLNCGIEIGSIAQDTGIRDNKGITIFKSVGIAVQDIVFSREVIRRLVAQNQN